jgi:hypothetical protein
VNVSDVSVQQTFEADRPNIESIRTSTRVPVRTNAMVSPMRMSVVVNKLKSARFGLSWIKVIIYILPVAMCYVGVERNENYDPEKLL